MAKHYSPKTVSIIGFGRFGQLLAALLNTYFDVVVYDKKINTKKLKSIGVKSVDFKKACQADVVFFAVPISQLETAVKKAAEYLNNTQTVLDVASVKVHSKKVFEKHLTKVGCSVILTHPMFGPDSVKEGLKGLSFVIHNLTADKDSYAFWKRFFKNTLALNVVELSPEDHDKQAAYSQGVTHFMGRVIDDMKLTSTKIDTKGFTSLMQLVEQTCNDTWQLFSDLQTYNPYTKKMRHDLERSIDKLADKLVAPHKLGRALVIGIQGGKGSFNEEACIEHCQEKGIKEYEIKYLYTSKRVLQALHDGEIDYGQVAMQNAIGGTVRETVAALAEYQCHIFEEFEFLVSHCLMIHPKAKKKDIAQIISHPQALAQCHATLMHKYPELKQLSGKGNLVDQATAAKALHSGKIKKDTAVLAAGICAEYYDLKIIDERLQDMKMNFTTFLWLKR